MEDNVKLSVEDFIKLRNLVYDRAGIYFETNKIYFVKKRVVKRVEALNMRDSEEYVNHLKYKDKFGQELQLLLNLMTTNETYFFREETQLKAFIDFCLPAAKAQKEKQGNRHLKIWSAGCSSGEEAYTLAILIREKIPNLADWKLDIYATDIDTDILAKANAGVYSDRSVRFVSPYIRTKYFSRDGENYLISAQIKNMVEFRHLNLVDGPRMRIMRNIDFLFCRNVLIYFDEESRKSVVANFYDCLTPGGFIYLGHSESVTRISTAFNIKRAGGLILHQKPGPQED